jgi:hypothetical protein
MTPADCISRSQFILQYMLALAVLSDESSRPADRAKGLEGQPNPVNCEMGIRAS